MRHAFEFSVETAIEQNQKTEAGGLDCSAFPGPRIGFLSRRIIEPVAGEGKSLSQRFKVRITRIIVAIEPEIRLSMSRGQEKKQEDYDKRWINLLHKI